MQIDFDVTPVLTGVTFPFSSPVIGSSDLTEQGFIVSQNPNELVYVSKLEFVINIHLCVRIYVYENH